MLNKTAVLSVQNQKGGVGKTTTCFHLGGALAKAGLRVLLIDTDPQASLSNGFLGVREARALDRITTTWAIAAGKDPSPRSLIRQTDYEGLDLVPGSRDCKRYNTSDPLKESIDTRCRLRDFVGDVGGYDVVLIDGPPNLQLFAWQSFAAATHLLVPTQPEDFGAQGLSEVIDAAAAVRERPGEEGNQNLRWLGVLLNMVDLRSKAHADYMAAMREGYPAAMLDSFVTRRDAVHVAITNRTPLAFYSLASFRPARELYAAVADEVIARIEGGISAEFPARQEVA